MFVVEGYLSPIGTEDVESDSIPSGVSTFAIEIGDDRFLKLNDCLPHAFLLLYGIAPFILNMASYRASSRPLTIAIGLAKFRCRGQTSTRLLSTTRITFESQSSLRPLQCHVGVSYASKDSPPFATRKEADESAAKGFHSGPIARWKDQMLGMGTLRTELLKTTTGTEGSEQPSDVEQAKELEGMIQDRKRWGAGEDFFFIRQGVSSCCSANSLSMSLTAYISSLTGRFRELASLMKSLPKLTFAIQKTILGLSDGVGGWASEGVDPSLFSQALMWHAYKQSDRNPSASMQKVLSSAYEGVMKEDAVPCGMSLSYAPGRIADPIKCRLCHGLLEQFR
jgi:hypothetical protein